MTDALSAPQGASASNSREVLANPRQVLSTRLARLDLKKIEEIIKKDDTTCCKVRSGDRPCTLDQFIALVVACDLKIVDKSRHCVKPEEFNFMRNMTARALANEQIAQQLTFDDPE